MTSHPQSSEPQASLTVFFPAYNDGGTIGSMVIAAVTTAQKLTADYEIIVVNDGSTDSTRDVLEELEQLYPSLRVIHHPQNGGYGAALRTGFASATKDVIFYTDGDAQYDPREMTLLWQHLTPEVDFVNGYKISRSDPLHRIVLGRLYHYLVKTLFGLRLRDVDCDFRLMRRRIFDQISQQHIDYMLSKIPRGRFVRVEEIAAMVAWMVSEENSFTTGAAFDLSGGRATY